MTRTALLLALLLVSPSLAEEWSRPYDGYLPGTEPENTSVTLVRDLRTGAPLPGVSLFQYEEYAGDDFVAARLLAEARTDEFGLVWLSWTEMPFDCHWVFDRRDSAVTEEYGSLADEELELAPGRTVTCRLLDPYGRPRAGVGVEAFLGCGHSPAVRYATTDRDGVFVLRDIEPSSVRLWFVEEGLRSAYWELDEGWGTVREWVARPSRTLHGLVVDRRGFPVANAVVRSLQQFRGPVAVTDVRGRFRLLGWDPGADLGVHGPGASGSAWLDQGAAEPGRQVRIVIDPEPGRDGRYDSDADDLEVHLTVIDAVSGRKLPGLEVALIRPEDGHVFWGETAEEPAGETIFPAPPGRHLLRVGHVFSSHVSGPVPFEAGGGPRTVKARRQPALAIDGAMPEGATADLIVGESVFPLQHFRPHLPPEAEALVRVEAEGLVRLFPVGPVENGSRRVAIDWPRRKRVRVSLPDDCKGSLFGVWSTDWEEGVIEAHASGRQVLAVQHADWGTQEIEVDLPDEPGAVLDLGRLGLRPPGELTVLLPGGSRADRAYVSIWDGRSVSGSSLFKSWHLREGAYVRVSRDGLVDLRGRLEGPGPDFTVHWGESSLEVKCRPEQFVLYVDGELYEVEDGRLRLEGLTRGPHTVIVGAPECEAQVMRVELGAGEHRVLDVELE